MKYFLDVLYKSFTNPVWFSAQAKQVKKSTWFFVLTVLVLAFGATYFVTFRALPTAVGAVKNVVEKEVPDFHATVTDHQLSVTGMEQPYVRKFETEEEGSLVLIVDTVSTSTLSVEQFVTSSEKAILITKDHMLSNTTEIFGSTKEDFSDVPNMSFSRADAIQTLENLVGSWRPMIMVIILAIVFLIWGLGLLAYLLICSSLVYLVYTRTTKQPVGERYTWKEVFTLSIFAFALPKIVMTALSFGLLVSIPYVVTLAMVIAVFRALGVKKTVSEQENGSEMPKL
ncbi:MAG: DUF1189 family protein [Candidatus Magasanikbacteria bacterium]|nr:DUF1189 family protein [Candidatus Magasanikbacteria bacterium]